MMQLDAFIFDLDGVLTDTAKFHYQAWKRLADEMGAAFNWEINHQLRGVSRRQSMEIIFKDHDLSEEEIQAGMARKNDYYQSLVMRMSPSDVLPGALQLLKELREKKIKIGLGSASKNARTVLDAIGLTPLIDVIGDGYSVERGKPEPDLFLYVAHELGAKPENGVVFEDAKAGIEAANRAGMYAVGIGEEDRLPKADVVYPDLEGLTLEKIQEDLESARA
ncbi:MAG: beta-phosphoglucomutase [Brevefilum sp.]